jgi:4-amino-4-deoxy-L-arabinose transferase-like glycosyltransferase
LDKPGIEASVAALAALKAVSCLFAILTLIPAALFARRLRGDGAMLGTLALMAFAPVQIHLAQHRMIDGFFAFWALMCLWLLWENLRAPNRAGWLVGFALSLAAMVMTKENAFFVYLALGGLIVANRWGQWGTVTSKLLLCMIIGPLLGLTTLIALAGGKENFIHIYQILVAKASTLEYAIRTGDGPWYRYFVDYMLMSPIVLILAIGASFAVAPKSRPLLFCLAFMAGSYVIMCNVKYGMNLRYTTIWDMPLRLLAYAQLAQLTQRFGTRQPLVLGVLIAGVCAYEARQYYIFFVEHNLYELVVGGLLYSLKMLKGATPILQ